MLVAAFGKNGGFQAIASNRRPGRAEKRSLCRYSLSNPHEIAFLEAQATARGLMSTAMTVAPLRAAKNPMIPQPVPISRKVFPSSGRDSTYSPRIELLPKYFGRKTVGHTRSSK